MPAKDRTEERNRTLERKEEEYRLLRRYAAGDEAAFNALYDRYAGRLMNYVYRCVGDWQEAEDIVQEVFLQVMKDAASFEPRAALATWMFRIATFMCLKRKRDKGIRGRILARETEAGTFHRSNPETEAGENALKKERLEALRQLVDALPEEQKSVFVLREQENLPYREIARILDIELGTVKSRLFRAREMLRQGLKERGLL